MTQVPDDGASHGPDPARDARDDARERARDGLRRYARAARDGTTDRLRRSAPGGVVAVLVAAAAAPVVGAAGGVAGLGLGEAVLGQIGAVGAGYLAESVLTARRRLAEARSTTGADVDEQALADELAVELAAELEQRLADGGPQADALRAELADVLRAVDAVGALVEDGLATTRGEVRDVVADALVELGGWHQDFAWVLDDLGGRLDRLQEQLARMERDARSDATVVRQSFVSLTLLRAELARLGERIGADREIARHPDTPDDPDSPPAPGECPYPGLAAFRPEQAGWFRGREPLTATLVERLATGAAPLLVIGASGAGKSSLLMAGLLPAVAGGALPDPGSQDWPWVVLTPGPHPVESLASAVAAVGGLDGGLVASGVREAPERIRATALTVLRTTAPGPVPGPRRLVLVVDQFEELYTLCRDDAERQLFLEALAALWDRRGTADGPAAFVVLGVRADHYGRCADEPLLRPALDDGPVLVGPLTDDELRLAVSKPATLAGWSLEAGLVEALRADLAGRPGRPYPPGALPLLAHALRETWRRRSGRTLTLAGYRATGGLEGAVAQTAEQLHDALDDDGRAALRALVTALVDDGVDDAGPVRRRVSRPALLRAAGGDAAADVLDRLVVARLVTATDGTLELTHEAVLTAWPRLRDWLADDAADRRERRALEAAAAEWARHGRDDGALLRGTRLVRVEGWARDPAHRARLSDVERDLLDASLAARTAQERAARARSRRLTVLAAVLAALVVATSAVSVLALRSRADAEEARRVAVSRALAVQALAVRATEPRRARALALGAWDASPTAEARGALLSLATDPYAGDLRGGLGEVDALALSPDGRTLAVAGDGRVELWAADGSAPPRALAGDFGGETSVVFSPDGATVAAGGIVDVAERPSVRWWDVASGEERGSLVAGPVSAVGFVGDGRLAVGQGDRAVHLYDLAQAREVWRTAPADGFVWDLATSPDGTLLAGGTQEGEVLLWDASDGDATAELRGAEGSVQGVAFTPDGGTVVAAGVEGLLRRWDVTTGRPAGPPLAPERPGDLPLFAEVAVRPDGARLAAVGAGSPVVQLWEAGTDITLAPVLLDRVTTVRDVTWSDDSRWLYLGRQDGSVSRWRSGSPVVNPMTGPSLSVDVSGDGTPAVAAGADGTVIVWEPPTGRVLRTVQTGAGAASAALAPDGRQVAVSTGDGIRLYEIASGAQQRLAVPPAKSGVPRNPALVRYLPDGGLVVATTIAARRATTAADDEVALLVYPPGRDTPALDVAVPDGVWTGMAVTGDGRRVVGALSARPGAGTFVRVWDAATGTVLGTTDLPGVTALSAAPRGQVVAGSLDGVVRVLDPASDGGTRVVDSVEVSAGQPVRQAVLSPDGRTLAVTLGSDPRVYLTDPVTGARVAALDRHQRPVEQFTFTPDGRSLVTTSQDSTVVTWPLDPAAARDRLCTDLAGPDRDRELAAVGEEAGVDDLTCEGAGEAG